MPPRGKISGFKGAEKQERSAVNRESDPCQDERMNLETGSALEKFEVSFFFFFYLNTPEKQFAVLV